jgi:hypothetical protein
MANTMSPEEVVIAWNDVYSTPDPVGAKRYMSLDFKRFVDRPDFPEIGLEMWCAGQVGFFPAFPDWEWEMRSIQSSGNVVACEFVEHGTFTLPYTTIVGSVVPPTGESYRDYSGLVFTINEESLICRLHAYYTNDLARTYGFGEMIAEYAKANNIGSTGWS